jgi:hypothetical protein
VTKLYIDRREDLETKRIYSIYLGGERGERERGFGTSFRISDDNNNKNLKKKKKLKKNKVYIRLTRTERTEHESRFNESIN